MSQKRNDLIKRASLHPLSFDFPIVSAHSTRSRTSSQALLTRSYSQDDSLLSSHRRNSYEGMGYSDFSHKQYI